METVKDQHITKILIHILQVVFVIQVVVTVLLHLVLTGKNIKLLMIIDVLALIIIMSLFVEEINVIIIEKIVNMMLLVH